MNSGQFRAKNNQYKIIKLNKKIKSINKKKTGGLYFVFK